MDIVLNRRPVSVPILPIAAGVLTLVVLAMSIRFETVQGSELGVFVNNITGDVDVTNRTGTHVYFGLTTDFQRLDNSAQTLSMKQTNQQAVNVKTADGSNVSLDVEVNYRLIQSTAVVRDVVIPECGLIERVPRQGAVEAYKLRWVRDFARSVIRYKFGELETGSFYESTERDAKARESEVELNRLLEPHGLQVLRVVPEGFQFYAEYEAYIADKQAADQETDSQEQKAAAAVESQQLLTTEATARANAEIAKEQGVLQQQLLAMEAEADRGKLEAEAYAYTVRTTAEAEFYKVTNDAQAILAKAKAEAEGLRQLATSLQGEGGANLVKMEYAKALLEAEITGVPYATDPRIQKVELSGVPSEASSTVPGRRNQ